MTDMLVNSITIAKMTLNSFVDFFILSILSTDLMFRRISFRAAGVQKTEKRAEGFAPGAKRLAGAGHHRTLGKEHGDRL